MDQLEVNVERLVPWLKDDISSSGFSNPRTPIPDIALEDILEFEAAEPEQLNESEAATQIHPDLEHLHEIFESEFLNQSS